MKFLRNTATDFFAHRARFIFDETIDDCGCGNTESSKEVQKQEVKEKVIQEKRTELTDCARGIWSTKSQNERAKTMTVNANNEHPVSYGDTLGSIVKGMTGKLNYNSLVLYKSKKLTPARMEHWKNTNDCFPIPDTLGQEGYRDKVFQLRRVNAIYPGQIVYIENGIIVVDDGQGGVVPKPSPQPNPNPNPNPNPEDPNCDIDEPVIISDCESDKCKHEFTEIWNGIEGGDPKALEALKERTGIAVESAVEAREAFFTLYGRKEMLSKSELKQREAENKPTEGVYTVLERHYNPKSSVPLWNSLMKVFGKKRLTDTFIEAGYENAEELAAKFTGAVAGYENINSNAAKFAAVAEDKHDGSTVEALIRIGTGAAVAVGMAAALGTPLTAPLVLAGVPLMKFRTGIKRFEKTPSVNKIAALFLSPEATTQEYSNVNGKLVEVSEEEKEKPYTYIEIQKKAIGDAEIVAYLAKDAIDANVALKRGPHQAPMVNLTSEEEALYKSQAESMSETKGDVDKVLDELAKNGYYFENSADNEADYASRAKKFKLGRLGLSLIQKTSVETSEGTKSMSIRNAFDFYMGQATSSLGFKSRKESYEKAMDLLVGQFNIVAQDELDTVWRKNEKLTLVSLDKAFRYGKEFDLGALPNKEKYDRERRLCVKFRPTAPGQANNTEASGQWVMYVKEITDGEVYTTREVEYRSANALIGKKEKHITLDDIALLGGNTENRYSGKEQREILKRLDFFDLMVGQMAQMNETKDQMQLSTSNKKVMNELTRVESLLNVNMRCKGTEVEPQEQYQYRVAVGAKLGKYKSFSEFKAGVEKFGSIYKFSPAVLGKIEKVYTGEPKALDALVANQDFQKEMCLFTQRMECVNEYLALDDLDACAAYVQKHTYFSGETAMRQSTNATVSFGDAYLVYLAGQGVLNKTFTEQITTEKWRNLFSGETVKNELGYIPEGAGWYLSPETQTVVTKIQNYAVKGWLDKAGRKAVIASSGGILNNSIINLIINQPEN